MSARHHVLVGSVLATATAVSALLAVPTAVSEVAAGDPVWGPVTRLAASTRGESLVVDARGATTVVWATTDAERAIVALRRTPAGTWQPPVVIGRGQEPRVAADQRGNLTVAWLGRRGHQSGVLAARRPVGGPWSEPVWMAGGAGKGRFRAAELDLAVGPRGASVVAWAWGRSNHIASWHIRSSYRPAAGRWGAPVTVSPAGSTRQPQVAVDAGGGATVLYGRQVLGQPQALRAQRRLKDGRWSSPVTVARDGYRPSLSVDASGSAVTVFATSTDRVAAARKPAGKRWKRSRAISPKGVEIVDFDVTVRNGGTALVAIGRASGRVDLVQRPPRGTWSVPQRVAAAGSTVYDVLVAAGPAGDTFVGWGGYALFGKYRADEGSWSRRYTISPDAGSDVLEAMYAGVAPDGDVVVLWEQEARPLKVRTMGREDPAGD